MLIEIRSDQFRTKAIRFHSGLNVVLGDDNATNSIGKSSLLMVIDFALGGSSLLDHNKDIVEELGHHDYYFSFKFDNEIYRFRRGTYTPDLVYRCDDEYAESDPIELVEFTAFLKAAYDIQSEDISFRSLVGLYSRVWGKDNLNVHKPLHIVQTQSPKDCVNNLIKTYGRYGPIRELTSDLKEKDVKLSALSQAFKNQIIPKIGKREHKNNEERIDKIESEINDIKVNLARYATNISEIANREILDLKVQKDELLAIKLRLDSKLIRIQRNIAENRYIKSRHFIAITKYFPDINKDRLAKVEEFHSGLAKVLRSELKESENELIEQISRISSEINSIDSRMATTLNSLDNPSVVVDRVYELSNNLKSAKKENEYFESNTALRETIKDLKSDLSEEKIKVIKLIENTLNDTIRRIVTSVFDSQRKSPVISITESNYSYEVFEDTGTGTAYTSLIVLDLAVFSTTTLPTISHDSVLFKNIENDSVANLLNVYLETDKQSFIALDEVDKYGKSAAMMVRERSVVQLDNDNVLYIKDWRKK